MDNQQEENKKSENLENLKKEVGVPTDEEMAQTGVPFIDALTLQDLRERPMLASSVRYHGAYRQRMQALAIMEARQKSRELIESRLRRVHNKRMMKLSQSQVNPESSVTMKDEGAPAVEPIETYVEEAKPSATTEVGQSFAPLHDGQDQQYSLAGFFERPVLIDDGTIFLDIETTKIYDVWDLWSKNPTVRSKLTNYAYFRGNLTVRVAISGTPFHYGKFLVAYYPYGAKNDVLQAYLSAIPFPANEYLYPCFKTYLSQCPGVAYIDVKENEPLEVHIPFMWHKQKACLFNKTRDVTITNAMSFDDFVDMGQLIIVSLNRPKMARDDTQTSLSYNIYAFADSVELSAPTSTDVNVVAESKVSKRKKKKSAMYEAGPMGGRLLRTIDEAGSEFESPGPIEKIATSISKAGSALTDLPYVGPFAKATAVATGAIAKFASFFGLSRVPVITAPSYVYNRIWQNGANVVANDTVQRLTVDPKQEVSIEQALEDGEDCMTIAHIARRESFLTAIPWTNSDPAGTAIWRSCVTPLLSNHAAGLTNQFMTQPTAMCFAVTPFTAWRAKIHFRIEVVCSQFHRGKLLIRYEPNLYQQGLITSAGLVLTQQNSMSIDIQETQELEFVVDWAAERPFCVDKYPLSGAYGWSDLYKEDGTKEVWQIATIVTDTDMRLAADSVNGFLYIAPINDLVEPDFDTPAYINVYTWATDVVTTVPREYDRVFTNLTSRHIYPESAVSLNPTGADNSNVLLDHYGEQVTSFRTLLKRYTAMMVEEVATTVATLPKSGLNSVIVSGTRYPSGGYRYRFSPVSAADTGPYIGANWFNYLRYAYLGVRGSYRYRIKNTQGRPTYTTVINTPNSAYSTTLSATSYDGVVATIAQQDVQYLVGDGYGGYAALPYGTGAAEFHTPSNGGVEFEVPFYDRNLFLLACRYDPTDLPNYCGEFSNHVWTAATFTGRYLDADAIAALSQRFDVQSASGEDFTFLRFQGAPFSNYVI